MGQLFGVRATKGKTRLNQYVFALDNLRLLQLVLTRLGRVSDRLFRQLLQYELVFRDGQLLTPHDELREAVGQDHHQRSISFAARTRWTTRGNTANLRSWVTYQA